MSKQDGNVQFWVLIEECRGLHFQSFSYDNFFRRELQTEIRAVWLHHPLAGCLQWDDWSLQGGLGSSRIHAGEFQGLRISRETLSTPAFEIDLSVKSGSTNFQFCMLRLNLNSFPSFSTLTQSGEKWWFSSMRFHDPPMSRTNGELLPCTGQQLRIWVRVSVTILILTDRHSQTTTIFLKLRNRNSSARMDVGWCWHNIDNNSEKNYRC